MRTSLVIMLVTVVLVLSSGCGGGDSSRAPSATPTAATSLSPPPTPHLPVGQTFKVTDYGATPNDSTDDAQAIGRAFMAADRANGGTVLLPPGTYMIASQWDMPPIKTDDWLAADNPTIHRTGLIYVQGYGATVKYAAGVGRVSWLGSGWPDSPWTTQGHLVVEGVTIDNNMQDSDGEVGRVLWLHDCNVENVLIRNVTMKNVKPRTSATTSGTVDGIFFKENFDVKQPGHRAFMRDITILDSVISAQSKPIYIGSDYYGEDHYGWGVSPMVVDDLDIERVRTDNNHHLGTGIHLGGHAAGGTAVVRDVTCSNSSDNLIEIDAFNDVTVERAHLSKAASGVGFTWFSFPYRSTIPVYRIIDSDYSGLNDAYWDSAAPHEPRPSRNTEGSVYLGALPADQAGVLLSRSWGDLIIAGNSWTNGAANIFFERRPAIGAAGAYRHVIISDNRITDIDSAHVGGPLISVHQLSGTAAQLTLNNNTYRAGLSVGFVPLPSDRISLEGPFVR